jgi:hypothetical protein
MISLSLAQLFQFSLAMSLSHRPTRESHLTTKSTQTYTFDNALAAKLDVHFSTTRSQHAILYSPSLNLHVDRSLELLLLPLTRQSQSSPSHSAVIFPRFPFHSHSQLLEYDKPQSMTTTNLGNQALMVPTDRGVLLTKLLLVPSILTNSLAPRDSEAADKRPRMHHIVFHFNSKCTSICINPKTPVELLLQ